MATAEATEEATVEIDGDLKDLGDKIVGLTLLQAKQVADYLENVHGIKPAGGGAVMVSSGPSPDSGDASGAAEEKTEFDAVLTSFGDQKIGVIKAVRAITGLGLKEAKAVVEGVPAPLKEGVSQEEADKVKEEIEKAGGSVEIK